MPHADLTQKGAVKGLSGKAAGLPAFISSGTAPPGCTGEKIKTSTVSKCLLTKGLLIAGLMQGGSSGFLQQAKLQFGKLVDKE